MNKRIISLLLASVLALMPAYTNVYAEETEALGQEMGAAEVEAVTDASAEETAPSAEETAPSEDVPESTASEDVPENTVTEDTSETETTGDTSETATSEDVSAPKTSEDNEQTAVTEDKEGNNSAESKEEESITEEAAAEMILPDDPDTTAGTEEGKTETVKLDLDDEVLQFGGFPQEEEGRRIAKSGEASLDGLADEVADAIENLNPSVDVEKYDLTLKETGKEIAGILNANPTFFTVESIDADYNSETGKVSEVKFSYLAGASEMTQKYENEVARILSGIKSSWNDFQKLMYLHDYLVTHTQYDLTYSRYSAYNAIVDHSSVCQGYAEAYEDLANRAGIKAYLVSSRAIDHAWNLVSLYGSGYFVDCTWDDPLTGASTHLYTMGCYHDNFLSSQSQMISTQHDGTDWSIVRPDGYYGTVESAYGKYNNSRYDNAPWKSSGSSVVCLDNGKDVFLDDNFCLYEYDEGSGSKRLISDSVYFNMGSTLTSAAGGVYVNNEENIYRVDVSGGTLGFVYGLSASEKQLGTIYGIEGDDTRIRYDIGTDWTDADFVRSGYTIVGSDSVNSIKLNRSDIKFTNVGETTRLSATVEPAGVAVIWGSSNNQVATVDNGLVTAKGPGEATIYAKAGSKTALCTVTVENSISPGVNPASIYATSISSIKNSGSGLTVKVKKVSGATGYIFQRRINGGKWSKVADQTGTTFKDKGANKNGKKYEYRVYAYRKSGSKTYKSTASAVAGMYYLSKPSISKLTSKSKSMTVKWGKNGSASGYQIEYNRKKDFSNSTKVNISGKKTTSKKITKLKKGKTYYVRIRTYKKNGNAKNYSAWSDMKKIKIK